MKISYYPDTDSLYIDLSEQPSAVSREISEGVVLDYDAQGRLVGIDIDNASNKVELKKLTLSKIPATEKIIRVISFDVEIIAHRPSSFSNSSKVKNSPRLMASLPCLMAAQSSAVTGSRSCSSCR
ncbi:MAG: DUF2283 domain-containing protein [Deltaproteobacteria bacterium]|nr:MAG: DUF2283 domain-containing protein [Deltaproteobacteria bacterium]